jgi:hypothetical protein
LTSEQCSYAALDAWSAREIFVTMHRRHGYAQDGDSVSNSSPNDDEEIGVNLASRFMYGLLSSIWFRWPSEENHVKRELSLIEWCNDLIDRKSNINKQVHYYIKKEPNFQNLINDNNNNNNRKKVFILVSKKDATVDYIGFY